MDTCTQISITYDFFYITVTNLLAFAKANLAFVQRIVEILHRTWHCGTDKLILIYYFVIRCTWTFLITLLITQATQTCLWVTKSTW